MEHHLGLGGGEGFSLGIALSTVQEKPTQSTPVMNVPKATERDIPVEGSMKHEDMTQFGRVLTRREVLAVFGVSGSVMAVSGWDCMGNPPEAPTTLDDGESGDLPACVVRPEQTEGPYFVDGQLERSDIRSDPSTGTVSQGAPLTLTFNLSEIFGGGCRVLAGALIDVWHCDAQGVYSGVSDPGAPVQARGRQFLRGYQYTNANGVSRFTTIYPGWYRGRAVHVHFKVRTDVDGQPYEFTSQLYFDETLTDKVHALPPYAARGRRETTHATDRIFRAGGESLMARLIEAGTGYAARFDLGLDLSDVAIGRPDAGPPRSNRMRRGPRGTRGETRAQ